jgi:hypothetical protein
LGHFRTSSYTQIAKIDSATSIRQSAAGVFIRSALISQVSIKHNLPTSEYYLNIPPAEYFVNIYFCLRTGSVGSYKSSLEAT